MASSFFSTPRGIQVGDVKVIYGEGIPDTVLVGQTNDEGTLYIDALTAITYRLESTGWEEKTPSGTGGGGGVDFENLPLWNPTVVSDAVVYPTDKQGKAFRIENDFQDKGLDLETGDVVIFDLVGDRYNHLSKNIFQTIEEWTPENVVTTIDFNSLIETSSFTVVQDTLSIVEYSSDATEPVGFGLTDPFIVPDGTKRAFEVTLPAATVSNTGLIFIANESASSTDIQNQVFGTITELLLLQWSVGSGISIIAEWGTVSLSESVAIDSSRTLQIVIAGTPTNTFFEVYQNNVLILTTETTPFNTSNALGLRVSAGIGSIIGQVSGEGIVFDFSAPGLNVPGINNLAVSSELALPDRSDNKIYKVAQDVDLLGKSAGVGDLIIFNDDSTNIKIIRDTNKASDVKLLNGNDLEQEFTTISTTVDSLDNVKFLIPEGVSVVDNLDVADAGVYNTFSELYNSVDANAKTETIVFVASTGTPCRVDTGVYDLQDRKIKFCSYQDLDTGESIDGINLHTLEFNGAIIEEWYFAENIILSAASNQTTPIMRTTNTSGNKEVRFGDNVILRVDRFFSSALFERTDATSGTFEFHFGKRCSLDSETGTGETRRKHFRMSGIETPIDLESFVFYVDDDFQVYLDAFDVTTGNKFAYPVYHYGSVNFVDYTFNFTDASELLVANDAILCLMDLRHNVPKEGFVQLHPASILTERATYQIDPAVNWEFILRQAMANAEFAKTTFYQNPLFIIERSTGNSSGSFSDFEIKRDISNVYGFDGMNSVYIRSAIEQADDKTFTISGLFGNSATNTTMQNTNVTSRDGFEVTFENVNINFKQTTENSAFAFHTSTHLYLKRSNMIIEDSLSVAGDFKLFRRDTATGNNQINSRIYFDGDAKLSSINGGTVQPATTTSGAFNVEFVGLSGNLYADSNVLEGAFTFTSKNGSMLYSATQPALTSPPSELSLTTNSKKNAHDVVYTPQNNDLGLPATPQTMPQIVDYILSTVSTNLLRTGTLQTSNFDVSVNSGLVNGHAENYPVDTSAGSVTVDFPDSIVLTSFTFRIHDWEGNFDVNPLIISNTGGLEVVGDIALNTTGTQTAIINTKWAVVDITVVGGGTGGGRIIVKVL